MNKVYLTYYHDWKEGPVVRLQFKPFETYCPIAGSRPKIIIGYIDWVYKCKYAKDDTELKHWGGNLCDNWRK